MIYHVRCKVIQYVGPPLNPLMKFFILTVFKKLLNHEVLQFHHSYVSKTLSLKLAASLVHDSHYLTIKSIGMLIWKNLPPVIFFRFYVKTVSNSINPSVDLLQSKFHFVAYLKFKPSRIILGYYTLVCSKWSIRPLLPKTNLLLKLRINCNDM